ncbi:MAG: FtsQ-type POTRA domain-containing protein [Deltaproteobacteria bacterium]|nr:MAG: FtsQ-type POTRA domain-containing protein [Deltaproteobacteria bacterium]
MTVLEYKNYRKKSLSSARRSLLFSRRKKRKNEPKRTSGGKLKAALAALVLLILGGTAAGGYVFLHRSPLFSVKDLVIIDDGGVRGLSFDSRAVAKGKNIFSVSPEEIARKIMKNPWVKAVSVRKVYPSLIEVAVKKRVPVGMLNLDGKLYYVDRSGLPFKKVTKYDKKVFPIFTGFSSRLLKKRSGMDAVRKAIHLCEMVRTSRVRGSVSEIHYSPREGYSLVLKEGGLRVKLGRDNLKDSMRRLDENYSRVVALAGKAGYVDLQYPGRIIVGEKKKI